MTNQTIINSDANCPKPKRILLVDDEEIYLNVLAKYLINNGYEVDTTTSGKNALQLLKKNRYNLVITDKIMPEVTGLDLLKAIKSNSYKTEVIIVTGYDDMESHVEAINLGAFECLTKPIDIPELMRTIDKVRVGDTNFFNA
jgi:two-component system response regulator HydG